MTTLLDTKTCTRCATDLPIESFARNRQARDGRRSECRSCGAASARAYLLQKRFGISVEEYDRMFAEQEGVCALCGKADPRGRWRTHLHVDHDHDTGRVRGLLCYGCNYALGMLGDSPQALRRAYHYVTGEATR